MSELKLTETFYETFKDKLKIDVNHVLETYKDPVQKEQLENNITLFLRDFNDNHFSRLLLATQTVNGEELFSFAYWLPKQLIQRDIRLVDQLELFAQKFGCKIKILDIESYFIRKARVLIQGAYESPYQVMEILGSNNIPCEAYVFYKEDILYDTSWVDCYYCFAINNNRYLTWLYNIKVVNIKVKSEWYSYLSEIRDGLSPDGKSVLEIIHKKKEKIDTLPLNNQEDISDSKERQLEIPERYLKPFVQINRAISELQKHEKILVSVNFKPRCVFCGSESISKEHIFAKWMRDYFQEKTFAGTLYFALPEENLLNVLHAGMSKHEESSYGYTTQNVCSVCNGTWMSQLEDKAKSILKFDDTNLKNTIEALNLKEEYANDLSLWITVKALMLCLKRYMMPTLPRFVFDDLQKKQMPANFIVEVTTCETNDLNFVVNKGGWGPKVSLRLKEMDRAFAEELSKDLFVVSIQIGHFLFRVSYFDESNGLRREASLKPTQVLFPYGHSMPYYKIADEQQMWSDMESKSKLFIFNIGISLTDQ